MTIEGKGRYWRENGRLHIYVPSDVTKDSTFPFPGPKGDCKVRIDGRRLVVEKA